MKVRSSRELVFEHVNSILIRGTNWIGDVIMTLPAIAAVRETFPHAKVTVLAKPWVADVYGICKDVDEIFIFQSPGVHHGIVGKYRLARELQKKEFDAAILLQNAIEAAIIAWLARIPIRVGYNSDGRGFLLTHSVVRTDEIRKVHQINYYLEMLKSVGFRSSQRDINLALDNDYRAVADDILKKHHIGQNSVTIGIAPGATYGPAKMWFPERFAAVADRLVDDFSAHILLFGSDNDRDRAERVQQSSNNMFLNLAGNTSLKEALALISRCDLFISNDSGLMHVAGALGIPLVAIFGSTNPVTTSPIGKKSIILRKDVSCSPCLKKMCPTDFRCMDLITIEDVYDRVKRLLEEAQRKQSTISFQPSD
jgi:heptosyltransferase-2